MYFNKDWAVWIALFATFLAVLVALFKEGLVKLCYKPILGVKITMSEPDCHKTYLNNYSKEGELIAKASCYYFLLWVENTGKQRAEKVQVFGSRLFRRNTAGQFVEEKSFLPMNLRWSHSTSSQGMPEIFTDGISPKMGKHCDLGHIIEPKHNLAKNISNPSFNKTFLKLDLEVELNKESDLFDTGIYQLEIKLAAANAKPVIKRIEINSTGEWFNKPEEMFSKGIGIEVI